MQAIRRPTLLEYRRFRYLKVMLWLVLAAMLTYVSMHAVIVRYVLGIVSTLIVALLMWYGVAKRRIPKVKERRERSKLKYPDAEPTERKLAPGQVERRKTPAGDSWLFGGSLLGWLSAHVYLGTSLILLISLHSSLHFGLNVHTLAYLLVLLVLGSGFFGVYAYLNYPRLITQNMGEDSLESILAKVAELDEQSRVKALSFSDEINCLVLKSRQQTRIGGRLLQQLRGSQPDCPTRLAVQKIHQLGQTFIHDEQSQRLLELYSVLLHKEKLVTQARTEIALKARLSFWLYLHLPLSIGLVAAIVSHVVSILFYW